jgi:phospholipase C
VIARAALAATVALALGAASAPASPEARTPIEHFVVLMQENHSFDNYFGTFPGADGIAARTCMPAGGSCVRPFHLDGRAVPDLPHDSATRAAQYAGGRMDGFVHAASAGKQAPEKSVMGFYDGRDLPLYWNLARRYVLFDRFFSSAPAGSAANHMFWVSGRDGRPGEVPTIFDRLDERGISWKFYVENRRSMDGVQAVRVPLRGHADHVVDLEQYYDDLERGRLPQVAYIAPAGSSEQPPGQVQTGEALVRRLITALMRSDQWKRSAFMWTYDEWGGWFDHVRPPPGRGFRVPALLVSPYARRGRVDSTSLETASILRFIEDNWALEPLARRDAGARSFVGAFDFSQPPREPRILAAPPAAAERRAANRPAIYLGYGAAIVLAGLAVGYGFLRRGLA